MILPSLKSQSSDQIALGVAPTPCTINSDESSSLARKANSSGSSRATRSACVLSGKKARSCDQRDSALVNKPCASLKLGVLLVIFNVSKDSPWLRPAAHLRVKTYRIKYQFFTGVPKNLLSEILLITQRPSGHRTSN